jgi:parvulin-like peptidyl-prolyl isomerase
MFSFLRKTPLLLVLVLALAGAVACGGSDEQAGEATTGPRVSADVPADAIALVDTTKIEKAEFDQLITQAEKSYETQEREFPAPGTPEYETLKNQIVQYLVQREQFEQEAKDLEAEVTDEEIETRLDELKKQYFGDDPEEYEKQLESQGLTDEQVREDVRSQLLQQKIFDQVTADVAVTDEDVEEYYEANKTQFQQPATRDVRHILVKKKPRADELYQQLQDGGNFAALAREFSQDPSSAKAGGKLTIRRGETVPPFDKTAFELDTGELSPPVKTQFGFHIIEALTAVKPESVTPLADVEESIRQQLLQEKRNEAMTTWVEDLKAKYEDLVVYAVGYAPPAEPTTTGESGESGTGAAGESEPASTDPGATSTVTE